MTNGYRDDNLQLNGTAYWWNAPVAMSDYDLYDYNRNFVMDDDEIADLVKDNILSDPGITFSDGNRVETNASNGVVTLSGEVRNPRTKALAYADAFWSTGVVDVDNKINVKDRERRMVSP